MHVICSNIHSRKSIRVVFLFVFRQFLRSTLDYHPTFITFRFLFIQVSVIALGHIYEHLKHASIDKLFLLLVSDSNSGITSYRHLRNGRI